MVVAIASSSVEPIAIKYLEVNTYLIAIGTTDLDIPPAAAPLYFSSSCHTPPAAVMCYWEGGNMCKGAACSCSMSCRHVTQHAWWSMRASSWTLRSHASTFCTPSISMHSVALIWPEHALRKCQSQHAQQKVHSVPPAFGRKAEGTACCTFFTDPSPTVQLSP